MKKFWKGVLLYYVWSVACENWWWNDDLIQEEAIPHWKKCK